MQHLAPSGSGSTVSAACSHWMVPGGVGWLWLKYEIERPENAVYTEAEVVTSLQDLKTPFWLFAKDFELPDEGGEQLSKLFVTSTSTSDSGVKSATAHDTRRNRLVTVEEAQKPVGFHWFVTWEISGLSISPFFYSVQEVVLMATAGPDDDIQIESKFGHVQNAKFYGPFRSCSTTPWGPYKDKKTGELVTLRLGRYESDDYLEAVGKAYLCHVATEELRDNPATGRQLSDERFALLLIKLGKSAWDLIATIKHNYTQRRLSTHLPTDILNFSCDVVLPLRLPLRIRALPPPPPAAAATATAAAAVTAVSSPHAGGSTIITTTTTSSSNTTAAVPTTPPSAGAGAGSSRTPLRPALVEPAACCSPNSRKRAAAALEAEREAAGSSSTSLALGSPSLLHLLGAGAGACIQVPVAMADGQRRTVSLPAPMHAMSPAGMLMPRMFGGVHPPS